MFDVRTATGGVSFVELDEFVARLDGVHRMPSGIAARCPGHDDRVASLMVNQGRDGGLVLKCHAGCATPQILGAMSLSVADIMGVAQITARYEYVDKDWILHYTVERWSNPKTFRVNPSLPSPAERILYGVPQLEWARENQKIMFVVEGERDVDSLAARSIPACTNVGGAGKWLPHYSQSFVDMQVIVIADNDEPGRKHARAVAESIKPFARMVTTMFSPYGKDVSDMLDAGYTIDALQLLPEDDEIGFFLTSKIAPRKVEWAWPRRFPLGKLSIVEGDPGDGKSLLTLDLVARWSTGTPMPDGFPTPRFNCVIVSAEDEAADTIVPRLIKAGTDRDRVAVVEYGSVIDSPLDIATDMSALRKRIIEFNAKVVVFDPITAFLSEKTDSHNDASVRRALGPLKTLAATTGAAVIVVRHLNKGGTGGKALYRGGGSIGFVGAARACHLVAQHPEDPNLRVFAPVKMNLARKPETLTYEIVEAEGGEVYIEWRGTIDLSAQAVLDGPERKAPDEDAERIERQTRKYEREFLLDVLANGPLAWTEIVVLGKAEGFSARTLERARADVGLIKIFGEQGNASTQWARPPSTTDSEQKSPTSPLPHSGKALELGPLGNGEVAESLSTSDSAQPAEISDDSKEEQLMSMPLVCTVCGSAEASRFAEPWWTVRCKAHNPLSYGGGS